MTKKEDVMNDGEPDAKWCPFMAIAEYGPKCRGTSCQLWDRKQSDCGLKTPFVALG